jgi:hypothetical protein
MCSFIENYLWRRKLHSGFLMLTDDNSEVNSGKFRTGTAEEEGYNIKLPLHANQNNTKCAGKYEIW